MISIYFAVVLMNFLCILSLSNVNCNEKDLSQPMSCSEARWKCAIRDGCGRALQHYTSACVDIMYGRTKICSNQCHKALIALTSTKEGKNLMKCECEGNKFCRLSKQRAEVCRDIVTQAIDYRTVVSCSVAQWICVADPQCRMALNYYNDFCRAMFDGHKCSHRCNNSISILNRQEKAAKLRTCFCDGSEQFDCVSIRQNMDTLCFGMTELKDYRVKGGNAVDLNSPRNPEKPKPRNFSPSSAISWNLYTYFLIHLLVLLTFHRRGYDFS